MLSILDQYLSDNPSQHTYCMSQNNEFVILLTHALQTNIDITEFPTIWVVLSILLDMQDSRFEYAQYFQYTYNEYYTMKPNKYMQKLEAKCILIQERMYDSVNNNFDSISGTGDNGPTPLQGQQEEQQQAVNAVNKTIDSDTNDIIANYVNWSTNMHDDIETIPIDDIARQKIQRQMKNDTPVKTRDNRQIIDDKQL